MSMNAYGENDPLIAKLFRQTLIVMSVAELSTSLAAMLDGIIIAQFFNPFAVASYGLSLSFTHAQRMIGAFFASGTQIVYSHYAARGDHRKANEIFTCSAAIIAVFSCVMGLALYIFADEVALMLGALADPEHLQRYTAAYIRGLCFGVPFYLGMMFLTPLMNIDGDKGRITSAINVMLVVNLVGDLAAAITFNSNVFILALATSASYLCAFIVLLLHFRGNSSIQLRKFEISGFRETARAGLMPVFYRSFSMLRTYALNIIFVMMASTEYLAANTLVQSSIKVVMMCVAMGVGNATLAVAGVLYEEHDIRGLHQVFRSVLQVSLWVCGGILVAVLVFAPQILVLFGAGEIAGLATLALRIYIIGLPFICVKMFFVFYFQAAGMSRYSYWSSFAGEFFLLIVGASILGKLFGGVGMFIAYPVSEMLYILCVYILAWVKLGHFPHHIADMLFLPEDFSVGADKIIDVSINSMDEIVGLSEKAMTFCKNNGASKRKAIFLALVVEEMCRNIFQHGRNDDRPQYVDMKIIILDGVIKMRLRDNCRPFNPKERAEMLDDDDLAHHFGIRIVSGIAKDMNYANLFNMNQLTIEI